MAATVLGGAALVAILLALATSGIYAIMSFAVSQRTREIGVRAALGASRRDIALTVARRALTQVGLGVLLGLPVAARVFFEVQEDGGASVGTATLGAFATAALLGLAVTVVVGTIACTWPTLRALRIMPTEALREGT
jgi:putative ABC transport system permease protein